MAAPAPAPAPAGASARHPFVVLGIVLTAVFMNLLDVSIVNVAIPSIQEDLGASFAQVQLVLTGYQLAFACLLITGGRLGDIFGRKRLFVLGMSGFTLASALCGLAPSAIVLILARVLQGAAAGMMVPQVLAVIQVTIPPRDRGRAFGLFGATIGLATILGPLVGGVLISANLFGSDWRMIFLVNIPVGVAAVVLALRALPESTSPDAARLDLPGAALVTIGLLLVVFPLIEGRERGWPTWIIVLLVLSVPVLYAFVRLQQRKTREGSSPLVLMSLFSNRSFSTGLVLSGVFFAGIPAFFFTFGLYLQVGLGFSPLHAGLTSFPFALASGFASSRSDGLAKRLGTGVLRLGALLLALGMTVTIVVLHLAGTDLQSWQISPVLLLSGYGLGCFIAPLTNLILAGIQGREAGSASGVLTTGQQVGGVLGVALVGLVFFGLLGSHAPQAARDQVPALRSGLSGVTGSEQLVASFQDCFVRRTRSKEPSMTPTGCALPKDTPPQAIGAYVAASQQAQREDFLHAIERTLLFEVAVFLLAAGLVSRIPKVEPGQLGQAAPVME